MERQGFGWVETVPVTRAEQADERLLMGLRLSEGIDLDRIAGAAALSAAVVADLAALGLVETAPGGSAERRIRATANGRFVLNEIVLRLALSCEPGEASASPMDIRPSAD